METGSNKSLLTLIAVVVFGIFLSLSYYLFQDSFKEILAGVMDRTSERTSVNLSNIYNENLFTNGSFSTPLQNPNTYVNYFAYDLRGYSEYGDPRDYMKISTSEQFNGYNSMGITFLEVATYYGGTHDVSFSCLYPALTAVGVGEDVTISYWIKGSDTLLYTRLGTKTGIKIENVKEVVVGSEWTYVTQTFKKEDNGVTGVLSYVMYTKENPGTVYISNFKVEKGIYATPF
jgi:hypothetical protein